MVGTEKWSQGDIDTIFSLKYDQGWSEPMITDYVALHCPSHRNVKVAGIRYVLRSKRPSEEKQNDQNKLERKLTSTQYANDQVRPFSSQTVTHLSQGSCQQRQQPIAKQNENQKGLLTQEKLQQQFFCHMNRLVMLPQSVSIDRKQDQKSQNIDTFLSLDQSQALQQEIPILSHQAVRPPEKQNFDSGKNHQGERLQLPEKNNVTSMGANSQINSSTQLLKIDQIEKFTTDCLKNDFYHKALAACDERFRESVNLLEDYYKKAKSYLQEDIDQMIQTDETLKNFEFSFKLARPCIKELEAERQRLLDQEKNERMFIEIAHNQDIATLITELNQCHEDWNQRYQAPIDQEQLGTKELKSQGQIQLSPDHHIQKGEVIEQEYLLPFVENRKSANTLSSEMLSEELLPKSGLVSQDVQGDFSIPGKTGDFNEEAEKLAVGLRINGHNRENIDLKTKDSKMIGQQANCSVSSFDEQTEVVNQGFLSPTYFSDSMQSCDSVFHSLRDCGNDLTTKLNHVVGGPNRFPCTEQSQLQEMQHHFNDDQDQNLINSLSQTVFNSPSLNSFSESMNVNENGDEGSGFFNNPRPITQTSTSQNTTANSYSLGALEASQSCHSDVEYPGLNWKDKCKISSKQLPNYRVDKRRSSEANLNKQKHKIPHQIITPPLKSNRFGGIKGSPFARFGMGVNSYDTSLDPLCHASLYEDDYLDSKPQPVKSIQHQDFLNSNIHNSRNALSFAHPEFVASSAMKRMSLPEYSISAPALDTIVNLHNPEFHQQFDMPLDAHNWVAGKGVMSNLTLHSKTLNGRVTINMINPKFHSGFRINGVSVIPERSQELINYLTEEGILSDGIKKISSLIRTDPERYCHPKTDSSDVSKDVEGQFSSRSKPEGPSDQGNLGTDPLSNNFGISA